MLNTLFSRLVKHKNCQIIFCDFFDIIIHKNENSDQTTRLWSKIMIRELGLDLRIYELFVTRKECEDFLISKFDQPLAGINYDLIIDEVYNRLICTKDLKKISKEAFKEYFENSDYQAKCMSSILHVEMKDALVNLKEKGYKVYCASNFPGSSSVLKKYVAYWGMEELFEGIYSASDVGSGTEEFHNFLVTELQLPVEQVIILKSYSKNEATKTQRTGIKTIPSIAIRTPIVKEKYTEQKKYRKVVRKLYMDCNRKSAPPHSDYILFYYVYIERLYKKAKQDGIRNIFFLAREGLFLKKIFDYYQDYVALNNNDRINTHYFKASRNSLMLASFKNLEVEEFAYLKRRWPTLSVNTFLKNFNFSDELVEKIVESAHLENVREEVEKDFLNSEVFLKLKQNPTFIEAYDNARHNQKRYFSEYLDSFQVDIQSEGIHLTDVGWGGTMQDRLYNFFNEEDKIPVIGYYLGLREVRNITQHTPRYGFNFSVYPYISFFDNILMANVELNEQLLAAGHGSTIAYTDKLNSYTIEHHEENDKRVFEAYIEETQHFMLARFKELTQALSAICYDYDLEQYEMVDHALRIGLFASKRKVTREVNIYKGFYQNVGNFSVGLAMGKDFGKRQKMELIRNFFFYPERAFRYVLRFKPMLLRRKKYFFAYFIPSTLIYWYIKLRCHSKGLKPKKDTYFV